ncbi:hypothetical protein P691DRAFT_728233 [Macrolepiota fuliginosa MF-IS2]|uniref:Signal recognition particle subunit SRP72 n=1 Tax=Macrolepiota fuliginosa MF-IS2 TaxID=1400762 RepID=A0A9P6C5I4_9AGAR|nr:hypothetical protein P691DRAFT_728233 [Macrolepiota fuliginosa MF-IS2]
MPPPSGTKSKARGLVAKTKGKAASRKSTPKKLVSGEERVKRLFSSLCSQIDGGHFANAVKTCDKILRILPDDVDALRTKLFLLLQTDQYEPALAVIDREKDKSKLAFERGYALYRSHEDAEAQEVIKTLKKQNANDRGLAHLEAQLFYRDGLYQEACILYNELLDSTDPDTEEHSDILINLQAAQKHLDFINNDYLRAIDTLSAPVTNAIETAPPPAPASSIPTAPIPSTQQQPPTAGDKTKKVRMSRVPPGVVPGVTPPPDPERWLKKSERSTFNQGRRRRGGGGGATQGSASNDAPVSASTTKSGGGKGKRKK